MRYQCTQGNHGTTTHMLLCSALLSTNPRPACIRSSDLKFKLKVTALQAQRLRNQEKSGPDIMLPLASKMFYLFPLYIILNILKGFYLRLIRSTQIMIFEILSSLSLFMNAFFLPSDLNSIKCSFFFSPI